MIYGSLQATLQKTVTGGAKCFDFSTATKAMKNW